VWSKYGNLILERTEKISEKLLEISDCNQDRKEFGVVVMPPHIYDSLNFNVEKEY
jgi:hypothetical protein